MHEATHGLASAERTTRLSRPAAGRLRRKWPVLLALLVLPVGLRLVAGPAMDAGAQTAASVGPVAEQGTIGVGDRVNVAMQVRDVTDLNAADIRVAFDPTVLQVVDADPATDGVQVELLNAFLKPDFVLGNSADNALGIVWMASTQLNPSAPASGTGNLARIAFRGLTPGTSGIMVHAHKLVRPSGDPIPMEVFEASIVVGEGGPSRTPPPTITATTIATPSPPGTETAETGTLVPPTVQPTAPPTVERTATLPAVTHTVYCPFTYRYRR